MKASQNTPTRIFWERGYPNQEMSGTSMKQFMSIVLSVFEMTERDKLPPPRIEEITLYSPASSFPGRLNGFCNDAAWDRAVHTCGKALCDALRA